MDVKRDTAREDQCADSREDIAKCITGFLMKTGRGRVNEVF